MKSLILSVIAASTAGFAGSANAQVLCDWFPSGPRGSEKSWFCIEQLSGSRGIITFRSGQDTRSCGAVVKGTKWKSDCEVSTTIHVDGMTVVEESPSIVLSVMFYQNPETGKPAATVDFMEPSRGINGWQRWTMFPQ